MNSILKRIIKIISVFLVIISVLWMIIIFITEFSTPWLVVMMNNWWKILLSAITCAIGIFILTENIL